MKFITEPTLLLNEKIARRNMQRMAEKADKNNLQLKPHVKTHQSIAIGRWMRDYGINTITVSSVKMAEYFARAGWNDITIAFPCNPRQAERLNKLAKEIKLSILISDTESFAALKHELTEPMQVYIEIDTGSGRTGLFPSQSDDIHRLAAQISGIENLQFKGLYSHPGQSYGCRSKMEIREVHQAAVEMMRGLKNTLAADFPSAKICIGDTPCCSAGDDFKGIDEISPGNFVFYDCMQTQISSCATNDVALALACPVVARYPKRKEVAIHGGAVHLSKELLTDENGAHFGKVVALDDDLQWSAPEAGCYVESISQEHGIVKCSASFFKTVKAGDLLGVLPVHSCLTADTMQGYVTTRDGNDVDHLKASGIFSKKRS
jgi:D-serine deaminase-like pyridoxal phosphate-dependent protein